MTVPIQEQEQTFSVPQENPVTQKMESIQQESVDLNSRAPEATQDLSTDKTLATIEPSDPMANDPAMPASEIAPASSHPNGNSADHPKEGESTSETRSVSDRSINGCDGTPLAATTTEVSTIQKESDEFHPESVTQQMECIQDVERMPILIRPEGLPQKENMLGTIRDAGFHIQQECLIEFTPEQAQSILGSSDMHTLTSSPVTAVVLEKTDVYNAWKALATSDSKSHLFSPTFVYACASAEQAYQVTQVLMDTVNTALDRDPTPTVPLESISTNEKDTPAPTHQAKQSDVEHEMVSDTVQTCNTQDVIQEPEHTDNVEKAHVPRAATVTDAATVTLTPKQHQEPTVDVAQSNTKPGGKTLDNNASANAPKKLKNKWPPVETKQDKPQTTKPREILTQTIVSPAAVAPALLSSTEAQSTRPKESFAHGKKAISVGDHASDLKSTLGHFQEQQTSPVHKRPASEADKESVQERREALTIIQTTDTVSKPLVEQLTKPIVQNTNETSDTVETGDPIEHDAIKPVALTESPSTESTKATETTETVEPAPVLTVSPTEATQSGSQSDVSTKESETSSVSNEESEKQLSTQKEQQSNEPVVASKTSAGKVTSVMKKANPVTTKNKKQHDDTAAVKSTVKKTVVNGNGKKIERAEKTDKTASLVASKRTDRTHSSNNKESKDKQQPNGTETKPATFGKTDSAARKKTTTNDQVKTASSQVPRASAPRKTVVETPPASTDQQTKAETKKISRRSFLARMTAPTASSARKQAGAELEPPVPTRRTDTREESRTATITVKTARSRIVKMNNSPLPAKKSKKEDAVEKKRDVTTERADASTPPPPQPQPQGINDATMPLPPTHDKTTNQHAQ